MSSLQLTREQRAIVAHPVGSHARVLAVAGSGKTTTMVHRARHLIGEAGAAPGSILVLMFNRLARRQFEQKLAEVGLPPHLQPKVYTFHAFAYRFIRSMVRQGRIPRYTDMWVGERKELYRINVRRAIENLERRKLIRPDTLGPSEVMRAIGLWKGALIPPERAGYRDKEAVAWAYAEFEKLRTEKQALTFDDFVPVAVQLIEGQEAVRERWCGRVDHLIVDEYQDVNRGQQRFVELIAGERADVMVVGDDDQTIYEWRGARPSYIVEEFQKSFTEKPRVDYRLSRSFRFGPLLAQAAFNTIRFNEYRVAKDVVAHEVGKRSKILLYRREYKGQTATTTEMVNEILLLVTEQRVPPREIAVLVRLYAQLTGIEIACLKRKMPYRVIGQEPFFNRQENMVLRHYVSLALGLEEVVTRERMQQVLSVANKPSRFLPRRALEGALDGGRLYGVTVQEVLRGLVESVESPLGPKQRLEVQRLLQLLERVKERVEGEADLKAGHLLQWLVDMLDYLAHFEDYYGPGETSFDRQHSVMAFLTYAEDSGMGARAFMRFLGELDTTQGEPREQQLIMTSVHRTKGLEWDHVFLPNVAEGFMPYLQSEGVRIYDKSGEVEVARRSSPLESERRLFYVALTRAREAVHIEAPWDGQETETPPSRFLEEIQLEPTRRVMNALQMAVAEEAADVDALLGLIRWYGGQRHITRLLVEGYLRQNGHEKLAEEVAEIAAAQEEEKFKYERAYREVEEGPSGESTHDFELGRAWSLLAADVERRLEQGENGAADGRRGDADGNGWR